MKPISFSVKASLLASIVLSAQSFAQSLPDEINHPQYQRIYENLRALLVQKSAEHDSLSEQKALIEKTISSMEQDQAQFPARNQQLEKLIAQKTQEIAGINNQIQGLEGVLGQVLDDLRKIDNMVTQLRSDYGEEATRNQSIQNRRSQVAQDVAQLTARLQSVLSEENQELLTFNRLSGELNASAQRRQEVEAERAQLIRNNDRFRTELPQTRSALAQNSALASTKKPLLSEAQARLAGLKNELAAESEKLSRFDAALTPMRTQLSAMKTELARISPEMVRLQTENNTLVQRIAANQARISSLNLDALIKRREELNAQVTSLKDQMEKNTAAQVELQSKISPTQAQIDALVIQLRQAIATRNQPEAARLRQEIEALSATIAPELQEIGRLQAESNRLKVAISSQNTEINSLNTSIANTQAQATRLETEIDSLKARITENERKAQELTLANSSLTHKIAILDAEIKNLEADRAPTAQRVAALTQQHNALSGQISQLTHEIQSLEIQAQQLTARISMMEQAMAVFPNEVRRTEAHMRQLDQKIMDLRGQLDRQQRLLARILQDRMSIQSQSDNAQTVLEQVSADLANSSRMLQNLQARISDQARQREVLIRYNQDSVSKLDAAKASRANAQKAISDSNQEISDNNQELTKIATQLPRLRTDLLALAPKLAAALEARNRAQLNATNANDQYQTRLALYQNYLSEAQALGADKASIGSTDGEKAGLVDAKTKANKLASENATAEAKWEAIRRGYTRGEISGFQSGFEIGMASSPDAQKGEEDGRVAGARRAKDQANMVIKPQKYLEELDRRLQEDETQSSKPLLTAMISQQVSNIKSMARELEATVPDLTAAEIAHASRISSSLDALIAESDIQIQDIQELRQKLGIAANVYSAPAPGENINHANCSSVYKGVRDFVNACKGAYVIRYQNLFSSSHSETFMKEYGPAFRVQIERVFDAELSRLYPNYFSEASRIAKEVGISTGRREVYQQSFARSENSAYAGTLPAEVTRVENEAVILVQDLLEKNAALTLRGSARLATHNQFGVSPGVDAELKMLIKNIGAVASTGNNLVRVTEVSGNLSIERKEAPLAAVAPRSHSDLSVMTVKVSEAAVPGAKVLLAGEIIHPGNLYRSSRVENFRIETVLQVNPAVDSSLSFDNTPKVVNFFGTKKHDISVKLKPKYAGVDQGYELTLEEVGSNFMEIISRPAVTEVLGRGIEKTVAFTYKLAKASRGKTVTLRLAIKNDGRMVSEETLTLQPE